MKEITLELNSEMGTNITEKDLREIAEKGIESKGQAIPATLPILPIREAVLYPKMILPLMVTQERLIKLIDEAVLSNRMLGLVAIKNKEVNEVSPEDLYEVGCAAYVLKMMKMPDGGLRLIIQGIQRVRLTEFIQKDPYIRARVYPLADQVAPRSRR